MRIVFWIKGDRGLACLDALLAAGRRPILVVGQTKAGHAEPPELAHARACGLDTLLVDDPNAPEALERLRSVDADAFVLAGYGLILGRETIAVPKRLCCNLHGGALPKYRGSSPLNWALIHGETSFTISVIEVAPRVDAGAVYAERTFPIGPEDTIADLHRRANEAFPELLLETILAAERGALAGRVQDGPASYYPRRFPDDGFIVWDLMTACEIRNRIRALTDPYPGAFTLTEAGLELRLLSSESLDPPFHGEPGRVYRVDGRGAIVMASDRAIRLTRVVNAETGSDALPELERYSLLATARGSALAGLRRESATRAKGDVPRTRRIGIVVQARMSSSRLPGKVLRPLGDRPMLELLLERLERVVGRSEIVVATSDRAADDLIAAWCDERGVPSYRGSLDDVAGRLEAAAAAHGFDAFVRVCADSPFLDPGIVRDAIDRFRAEEPDLVTNVFPRRAWPRGQSVEVIRRATIAREHGRMSEAGDREHVTPLFHRESGRFHIVTMESPIDLSGTPLVVDTPEDLEIAARMVAAMTRPAWEYTIAELLALRADAACMPASAR